MKKEVPKVSKLEILKNAFALHENPLPFIEHTMKSLKSDTYRAYLGMQTQTLMTQDPIIIQHVLQKNHRNYHKSEIQSKILARYMGKGLLTSNGAYWLQQRRLIQPGFHKKSLASFLRIMEQEIKQFVADLEARLTGSDLEININEEMSELTMRVVSRALFSSDIQSSEISLIRNIVDELQDAISKDIRLPFLKFWRQLIGEERRNDKRADRLTSLIKSKINARRNATEHFGDLLDMLLAVRYENTEEGMTDQQLIDEIIILYVAGYETTANALGWIFKLLDEHPAVLTKLRSELSRVTLSTPFCFEDARQFDYTQQVISEAMRLYPPAWIVDRVALDNDESNGVQILKGDVISIFTYGVHRSEKYWTKPTDFIPSRFDKDRRETIQPFSYFPFGGGPRLCIGNQFANIEMILSLYYLLTDFKFQLVKNQDIKLRPLVTLKPKHGIRMMASRIS